MTISNDPTLVKVRLTSSLATEAVWAKVLGDDKYQVKNTPFFSNNISFDDIVLAFSKPPEPPVVTRVLKKSGYKTFRILLADGFESPGATALLRDLESLGCSGEVFKSTLLRATSPSRGSRG